MARFKKATSARAMFGEWAFYNSLDGRYCVRWCDGQWVVMPDNIPLDNFKPPARAVLPIPPNLQGEMNSDRELAEFINMRIAEGPRPDKYAVVSEPEV
jgi:hypothetical protein